ncbi:hypothetical protein Pst134EA_017286 [Puccinia striiformis f. sp. tritici]|uniref:hypothetical protein n=1 Tax=Puccinia striiformis f. sp. tritici TaxID=168172 RepID=UPI00200831C7|nr:hypothetical protein Pst134EA_017286 [Puccinia striiformis f. sp. tritici]KAH9460978.1 hypothetical protein Pst134EA_017286 [Puccinia striiformis f. sp. tritici]
MSCLFCFFSQKSKYRKVIHSCWNSTSGSSLIKRPIASPLSGSLSKKPRAVGKGNDVTDVITNQDRLITTTTDNNNNHSNLLDRIFPPITVTSVTIYLYFYQNNSSLTQVPQIYYSISLS